MEILQKVLGRTDVNKRYRKIMKKIEFKNWRKHGFEFLSIFIAVVSAFSLNSTSKKTD
jgi:hypothetical protein